jgi:hypothetical protein
MRAMFGTAAHSDKESVLRMRAQEYGRRCYAKVHGLYPFPNYNPGIGRPSGPQFGVNQEDINIVRVAVAPPPLEVQLLA